MDLNQTQPKQKSKSWMLWALVIIALIAAGAYFIFYQKGPEGQPSQPAGESQEQSGQPTTGLKDCGDDFDCFITASQLCQPARMTHIVVSSNGGVTEKDTTYLEIKGMRDDKCMFFVQTKKIDFEFPFGTSQEEIDQKEEIYGHFEGRSGTCQFGTSDLASMLGRWKSGFYSAEQDWASADCTGLFFSSEADPFYDGCQIMIRDIVMTIGNGQSAEESVLGFKGDGSVISWVSKDPGIASVSPASGSSTMITGIKAGKTQIIAIDNSIGPDCISSVSIAVK